MQKFIETVEGENGRPVPGASITVYNAGTSTPATIYLSNGGAATANPLTADSTGMFYFYAADGRYDLLVSYAGSTRTIYDILLEDPVDANVINATTLTATTATISNGTVTTLASTNASITALNAVSATVTTLTATSPNFTSIGVGGTPTAAIGIHHRGSSTGATTAYGMLQNNTVQSDVTSSYRGIQISTGTQAASFTLSNLYGTLVSQATFGAGSTVTNQYGHYVDSSMTGATNNYGYFSAINSAAGRWNFYATGTALNYFAGRTLFGTTTDNGVDQIQSNGHIATITAGQGFKIKEGANAKMGTATLVAGAVTVSNTSVTANSRIFLTSNADGGIPGFLRVSARTASTSFTITSSSGIDTSTVAWLILEPA